MRYFLKSIYSILISYLIAAPLSDLLGYEIDKDIILTILFISHFFINIILFNKKIFKWFSIIVGSSVILTTSFMLIIEGSILIPPAMYDYFDTLSEAILRSKHLTPDMYIPTMFIICVIISVVIYLLIQKAQAYFIVSAAVFSFYAFLIIGKYHPDTLFFFLLIFISIVMYFERYFSSRLDIKKINIGLLKVLPAFLLFAVLLTSISSYASSIKSDPVSFIDVLVEKIKAIDIGKGSGRGDSEEYETEVDYEQNIPPLSTRTVMTVDSRVIFHLRSETYDNYDGRGWSISKDIPDRDMVITPFDIYMTLESIENVVGYYSLSTGSAPDVQSLSGEDILDMAAGNFDKIAVKIKYLDIKTNVIFSPAGSYMFYFDRDTDTTVNIDYYTSSIRSEKELAVGFAYTIGVLVPRIGSQAFINAMTNIDGEDLPDTGLFEDDMGAYLQIPDSVPERVGNLASSITGGYGSEYEKARAIEKYLSLNYVYSLDVQQTPPDEDYVDYFLFEQKTGFCTHYASAMVILLRSAGIPARYARGYIMPAKEPSEDQTDGFEGLPAIDDTIYTITENNAHAWPEAYIKGYGWLAFEPTTTYYEAYMPKTTPDTFFDPEDIDDAGQNSWDRFFDSGKAQLYLRILAYVLLVLLLLSPFILRIVKRMRYSSSDNRRRVVTVFKRITVVLGLIGYDMKIYETARSYAKRIDACAYPENKEFERIVTIFEEARYGTNEINIFYLNMIENYYHSVKRMVIKSGGRFKAAAYMLAGRI